MLTFKTRPYLFLLLAIAVFTPVFFLQADGLVPCGGAREPGCDFSQLVLLIKNITNFIILISAPVSAIMFSYAGYLYLTAAGDTGKISKAHSVFWTVLVGFSIILGAWLIVKALSVLVTPDFSLLGK